MKLPDGGAALASESHSAENGTSVPVDQSVVAPSKENCVENGKMSNGTDEHEPHVSRASSPVAPDSPRPTEDDLSDDSMTLRLSEDEDEDEMDSTVPIETAKSGNSPTPGNEPVQGDPEQTSSSVPNGEVAQTETTGETETEPTECDKKPDTDITKAADEPTEPEKANEVADSDVIQAAPPTSPAPNNENNTILPIEKIKTDKDDDTNDAEPIKDAVANGDTSTDSSADKVEVEPKIKVEPDIKVEPEEVNSELNESANQVSDIEPVSAAKTSDINNADETSIDSAAATEETTLTGVTIKDEPLLDNETINITSEQKDAEDMIVDSKEGILDSTKSDDNSVKSADVDSGSSNSGDALLKPTSSTQTMFDDNDTMIIDDDEESTGDNGRDSDLDIEVIEDKDIVPEEKRNLKRLLDVEENEFSELKKVKINTDGEDEKKPKEFVIPLDAFKSFMDKKTVQKLTRTELEEFCLQKMCETIAYRCELGETNRKLKILEKIVENWRNKIFSLNKQTKDLEIVTSKLIHDTKARRKENASEPYPVKITRSVGLQVCLTSTISRIRPAAAEPNAKRKRNSLPAKAARCTAASPTAANTPAKGNKSIKTILPVTPSSTPEGKGSPVPTPVRNTTPKTPAAPTPTTTPKPAAASKAVIDLTDEDEPKTKTPAVTSAPQVTLPAPPPPPPPQPQNNRVVPVQTTDGNNAVATNVPTSRLTTYVVQAPVHQASQVIFATAANNQQRGPRPTYMLRPIQPNTGTRPSRVNIQQNGVSTTMAVVPQMNGQVRAPYRFASQINRGGIQSRVIAPRTHPAPLPPPPPNQTSLPSWKAIPPRPSLKISRAGDGIVLSWRIITKDLSMFEEIASYQLYAYQETNAMPSSDMWRKVGDVKALALPMACTLTQFTDGHKYHFAVRAVDVNSRVGQFSSPEQIMLFQS